MTMMMMEESEGGSREEDDEEEEEDVTSQNSGSSKRQRRDSRSGSCGSAELLWAAVYVDPNLTLSPSTNTNTHSSLTVDAQLDAESRPATGRGASSGSGADGTSPAAISDDDGDDAAACPGRIAPRTTPAAVISNMITTSIAESASCEAEKKETFEYKDWEEIKETLTRASELCDRACPPSYHRAPSNLTLTLVIYDRHHVLYAHVLHTHRRRTDGCITAPACGDPRVSSFPRAIPRSFPVFLAPRRSTTARRVRLARLGRRAILA